MKTIINFTLFFGIIMGSYSSYNILIDKDTLINIIACLIYLFGTVFLVTLNSTKMKKLYREGTVNEMIVTVLNSDELHSLIVLSNGETIEVLNTELTDINAD